MALEIRSAPSQQQTDDSKWHHHPEGHHQPVAPHQSAQQRRGTWFGIEIHVTTHLRAVDEVVGLACEQAQPCPWLGAHEVGSFAQEPSRLCRRRQDTTLEPRPHDQLEPVLPGLNPQGLVVAGVVADEGIDAGVGRDQHKLIGY